MPAKWHFPFNVFVWSTMTFIVFLAIQLTVVMTFAALGYARPSPFLALFTWCAISSSITFGVLCRCEPSLNQLLVLQGFACFYMLCASLAVTLRTQDTFSLTLAGLVLASVVALFASGSVGVVLARVIRQRLPR
jgi:hypothetical protein